jgi:HEAT repeat protein
MIGFRGVDRMGTEGNNLSLEHFQAHGDRESLLAYIRLLDRNVKEYEAVVAAMEPVFDGLLFGERPCYESLDVNVLRRNRAETEAIVRWTAASSKADIKTSAIELMGVLGWDTFIPLLEQMLSAPAQWERLTAVSALTLISSGRARELLNRAARDPDPQVRKAARIRRRLP